MRRPAFLARQASRPAGFVGRLLLGIMSRETARFNAEVLDALAPRDDEHLLEIGYGHGRTLAAAASRAETARFAGLDVAPTSERAASRRCRALIATGRMDLRTGDAAALPWDDGMFDGAFTVHTIYFWSDPRPPLAELRRVIRPGGRVVLGMRERSDAAVAQFPPPTYRLYSSDEVEALLASAGFVDANVHVAISNPDLRIVIARAGETS